MILFKRDGYFHIEYFDETLLRKRRKSLRTMNKTEALAKLTDFKKSLAADQKAPSLLLSYFQSEYIKNIRQTGTIKYLSSVEKNRLIGKTLPIYS